MKNIRILYKRLSEIDADGLVRGVPGLQLDENYIKALRENPFREAKDIVCVKVGIVDDRVAGREYVFPLLIESDGTVISAGSGSCTTVEKWARRMGIGIELSAMKENCSDGDFIVGDCAGLSQMAVKIRKYLKQHIFEYPRFIFPLKSRAILEMKLKGALLKAAVIFVDFCLWAYSRLVGILARIKTSEIHVVEADPVNEQHMAILGDAAALSNFRFSELHNADWFKWVLTSTFSKYGPAKAYILYNNEKAVGFFMIKKRFYEQASHRGFKNVWLGSVIEWGSVPGYEKKLLWSIVKWVLKSRDELDAVEFPVNESFAQKFLKRLGWQQVGNANFAYNIRPNSGFVAPEGMDNPANWRLRPAMGDAGLS